MFEEMIQNLQKLEQAELQIQAQGEYPTKSRTEVAVVAKVQNDGATLPNGGVIKPARFVERAATKNRHWLTPWGRAVRAYIAGDRFAIEELGMRISQDISEECDRIKTGRLKKSFRPNVKL